MAHVLEFTIDGLAGRDNTYYQKLNRDVNIFFGLNGSGKTSLFKIIHSAFTNDTSILKDVPFLRAEVKIYSERYDQTFIYSTKKGENSQQQMNIDFNGLEMDITELEEIRRQLQPNQARKWSIRPKLPNDIKGNWLYRYLPTSRLYLGAAAFYSGSKSAQPIRYISEEQLDLYFSRALQELWSRYSADILSAVRKAQEDGLANILKAILSSSKETDIPIDPVDSKIAYQRVSAFLKRQGSPGILGSSSDFERRYAVDSQLRSVVSDINNVEQRIEHAMAPREKLQTLIQHMFSDNKSVHFRDRSIEVETNNHQDIGLSSLSSGEKQLLRIFVETLLARSSSMLIDEPELSMHIDWQSQLISAMRELNPSAQLILATHSPEIMANVEDDKIFRL